MIIILSKMITLFLNRTMSIHYFNVYNVKKNVIISKPHENQLFLQLMQRHHKWHHEFVDVLDSHLQYDFF